MPVKGGREKGFRGYTIKSNYRSGKWRVTTTTKDGRTIGYLTLKIKPEKKQKKPKKRQWLKVRM